MNKLYYYQNKFKNLPVQGSSEWLEGRSLCFGGSEMATLVGKNKYEKTESLITKKQTRQYEQSDATKWGQLFEPVAKKYLKQECGTIYEFGSITHSYYPISYSPDGLFMKDNELVLLEIKCPSMRGVDKIPESYLYQVQTGMNIINVEYCLFTQFRFRRCLFGTNTLNCTYDRKYHKEYRKRCADKFAISYGYLWWDTKQKPILDLAEFDSITPFIKNLPYPEIFMECNFDKTDGMVLQWKLFETSKEKIHPEENFLHKHETMLWEQYGKLIQKS